MSLQSALQQRRWERLVQNGFPAELESRFAAYPDVIARLATCWTLPPLELSEPLLKLVVWINSAKILELDALSETLYDETETYACPPEFIAEAYLNEKLLALVVDGVTIVCGLSPEAPMWSELAQIPAWRRLTGL
ncbi:MAG: hypothetical protein NZ482_01910 [Gloeomargarita sp. SKYG98]|nr:hypothetical protein [Gloeomargarita sp. SKYG98]